MKGTRGRVSAAEVITSEQMDRSGDRLLQLPDIAERTTLSEDSHRWLRHNGEGPPLFKLGRRLVAWESDVIAWIEEQRAAQTGDEQDTASA